MKFRKKPVVIEATQFWPDKTPWPDGCVRNWDNNPMTPSKVSVRTLEGWLDASPGDWIITGVKGEKYPCKPDVFAATYDAVEEQS